MCCVDGDAAGHGRCGYPATGDWEVVKLQITPQTWRITGDKYVYFLCRRKQVMPNKQRFAKSANKA
jgi:hypothetical protein